MSERLSSTSANNDQEDQKRVFKNASALFVIQIANMVLPFILLPYLTHVLGAQYYGLVAFGLGIAQLGFVITDYGFSLYAPVVLSKIRGDVSKINKVVGAIYCCRILLLLLVSATIYLYALNTQQYAEHKELLLLSILILAGTTLQPIWFFHGIEKMGYITFFSLLSRLSFLLLVVFFVATKEDYFYVALFNGITHCAAALLGLVLIYKLGYRATWPGWQSILETFKASMEFFWSRAAVSTYTAAGTVFLGLWGTSVQVAYYSAAEQLYKGAQAFFAPLSQALYPNMLKNRNFSLLFKVMKWAVLCCLTGVLIGSVIGEQVLELLFGEEFVNANSVLLIFLITLMFTTPSTMLGYPLLGALGKVSLANRSVFLGGALQLCLLSFCYLLGYTTAFSVALCVLLVELLVFFLRAYWGNRYLRANANSLIEKV
ncbi:oligosaccharide flippase family protein [Thalassotalea castellviae]|uniref:Oligosaccharide flippase family protein n=1 Tax=Thalassotalea castellviae TaxID=3075612 RepID=A0ABU2ZXZ9_9GAMM|nr:oligosaccharide flippase family protein [Thalassotalea sp. W431]MDT0602796.1 oligosaccharide flippase family protein [Thalassotalea sp. W431]